MVYGFLGVIALYLYFNAHFIKECEAWQKDLSN